MNQTKKLTQGAMLLAIVGALMWIDRQMSYFFDTFIILSIPVMIIVYSNMYELSDGGILAAGLAVFTFLFGQHPLSDLYLIVGLIVGFAYSYCVKKNMTKNQLMIISVSTFAISELVVTLLALPLFGYSINIQEEVGLMMSTINSGIAGEAMTDMIAENMLKLGPVIYIFAIILTGILEGAIVHLVTVVLLKRFKIKDLGSVSILNFKPNLTVTYLAILGIFTSFFTNTIKGDTYLYISTVLSLIGAMILIYYGYIFVMCYGALVMKKNLSFLVVFCIFFPPLIFGLIVLGFLFGSGPLQQYLDKFRSQSE